MNGIDPNFGYDGMQKSQKQTKVKRRAVGEWGGIDGSREDDEFRAQKR